MSLNISGFGIEVTLIASVTFPAGFTITQFADDADPFDIPSQQLVETAVTLNGDLLGWSKANPIPVTLSVIPQSEDDLNLAILAEANRVGRGKAGARDIITLTGVYPDDRVVMFSQGFITDAMVATSVASAGRNKSKTYAFTFENKADA